MVIHWWRAYGMWFSQRLEMRFMKNNFGLYFIWKSFSNNPLKLIKVRSRKSWGDKINFPLIISPVYRIESSEMSLLKASISISQCNWYSKYLKIKMFVNFSHTIYVIVSDTVTQNWICKMRKSICKVQKSELKFVKLTLIKIKWSVIFSKNRSTNQSVSHLPLNKFSLFYQPPTLRKILKIYCLVTFWLSDLTILYIRYQYSEPHILKKWLILLYEM